MTSSFPLYGVSSGQFQATELKGTLQKCLCRAGLQVRVQGKEAANKGEGSLVRGCQLILRPPAATPQKKPYTLCFLSASF